MFIDLLFVSSTVASFSLIWRKMLNDLPALRRGIMNRIPYPANRAITCGFCFTYWASLAAIFVFNPLSPWTLPLRVPLPEHIVFLVHLFASWMLVGFLAVAFRFVLVILQELVDYEMYTMNKQFHPLEHERDHSHR